VERWLTTLPFVSSLREKIRNWVNLKPCLLCPMRCHGQAADKFADHVMGRSWRVTMRSTRIGIGGACILLCTALAVASAAAQTQAAGTAGKPLALLQFTKNGEATLRPHSETAAKFATRVLAHRNGRSVRRTVAEPPAAPHALANNVDRGHRKLEKATAQARQAAAPEMPAAAAPKNVWPAADTAAPGQMSTLTPQPAMTPQPAPARATGGAVVEAASDDAGGAPSAATTTQPVANATQSLPASPPQPAAAKPVPPAPVKAAQTAAPEHQTLAETTRAAPAVRAMVATPPYEDTGPVGSASWIAHVLAALGGAFAAGAIAWFLISPASRPVG
jgi:hypothetical protein